uniref:BTB domain-containing protein n=1 Tax=Steinernema glaseri TaxID=37863 RepID=A0A1I7Y432_9BILA
MDKANLRTGSKGGARKTMFMGRRRRNGCTMKINAALMSVVLICYASPISAYRDMDLDDDCDMDPVLNDDSLVVLYTSCWDLRHLSARPTYDNFSICEERTTRMFPMEQGVLHLNFLSNSSGSPQDVEYTLFSFPNRSQNAEVAENGTILDVCHPEDVIFQGEKLVFSNGNYDLLNRTTSYTWEGEGCPSKNASSLFYVNSLTGEEWSVDGEYEGVIHHAFDDLVTLERKNGSTRFFDLLDTTTNNYSCIFKSMSASESIIVIPANYSEYVEQLNTPKPENQTIPWAPDAPNSTISLSPNESSPASNTSTSIEFPALTTNSSWTISSSHPRKSSPILQSSTAAPTQLASSLGTKSSLPLIDPSTLSSPTTQQVTSNAAEGPSPAPQSSTASSTPLASSLGMESSLSSTSSSPTSQATSDGLSPPPMDPSTSSSPTTQQATSNAAEGPSPAPQSSTASSTPLASSLGMESTSSSPTSQATSDGLLPPPVDSSTSFSPTTQQATSNEITTNDNGKLTRSSSPRESTSTEGPSPALQSSTASSTPLVSSLGIEPSLPSTSSSPTTTTTSSSPARKASSTEGNSPVPQSSTTSSAPLESSPRIESSLPPTSSSPTPQATSDAVTTRSSSPPVELSTSSSPTTQQAISNVTTTNDSGKPTRSSIGTASSSTEGPSVVPQSSTTSSAPLESSPRIESSLPPTSSSPTPQATSDAVTTNDTELVVIPSSTKASIEADCSFFKTPTVVVISTSILGVTIVIAAFLIGILFKFEKDMEPESMNSGNVCVGTFRADLQTFRGPDRSVKHVSGTGFLANLYYFDTDALFYHKINGYCCPSADFNRKADAWELVSIPICPFPLSQIYRDEIPYSALAEDVFWILQVGAFMREVTQTGGAAERILSFHSVFFKVLFSSDSKEKVDRPTLKNVKVDEFKLLLGVVYDLDVSMKNGMIRLGS